MSEHHRRQAALRSLEGLSVGDAFGECFFSISTHDQSRQLHLSTRTLPNWRWYWTDDTAMAISVVEILLKHGCVEQDALAEAFARRYMLEDNRGYGGTAHGILRAIHSGRHWREVSPRVLSGSGSMGNGAAMRVAPLGAFFCGDVERVVEEARKSAEITHAHQEGKAGAVAAALAAAFMATNDPTSFERERFFHFIIDHLPDGLTRARIIQAKELAREFTVETAVAVLGNGTQLTAPDTVPFCLWCASQHPSDFESAMWLTVSGGGDMDTNCAIVGGILAAGILGSPPATWIARREPLPEMS